MYETWRSMGLLRNLLHLLAVSLIFILPFSEPAWHPEGAQIILGAVIPAVAPMIVIIIMLDTLMGKVFQSDAVEPEKKAYYGAVMKTNLSIALVVTLMWLEAFNDALF